MEEDCTASQGPQRTVALEEEEEKNLRTINVSFWTKIVHFIQPTLSFLIWSPYVPGVHIMNVFTTWHSSPYLSSLLCQHRVFTSVFCLVIIIFNELRVIDYLTRFCYL
jgi:hypothetical protein